MWIGLKLSFTFDGYMIHIINSLVNLSSVVKGYYFIAMLSCVKLFKEQLF